jgi:hypothetical protein
VLHASPSPQSPAGSSTVSATGSSFPIIHTGQVLGFVGRRRPDLSDIDRAGPKYLNTGDTPLFHKGAQLFGGLGDQLSRGAIPVIVEGPMDAIAVTLASHGRYLGVAPLGTSLTDDQAHQLARIGRQPMVATDADLAGRIAAERDFWLLSCYRLDALHIQLPNGTDPAELLANRGPTARDDDATIILLKVHGDVGETSGRAGPGRDWSARSWTGRRRGSCHGCGRPGRASCGSADRSLAVSSTAWLAG